MEYWSIGVLDGVWDYYFSILHRSITPSLQYSRCEFLLGHRPNEWTSGNFALGVPVGTLEIVGGLLLIGGIVWLLYKKTTIAVPSLMKVALITLRSAALIVLGLCLLQPMLTSSKLVPQQGDLAVVVDNSRSMTIRDAEDGHPRGAAAVDLLFGQNGLVERLQNDFHLRTFRIDTGSRPISGPGDLTFSADRTALAEGLQQVVQTLQGLPLSGLILVSDGADNGREDPTEAAQFLKILDIPIFTVGLGQPVLARDREITRVTSARTVLEGTIFDVNVTARSRGYGEREFEILIEEGGKVVAGRKVKPGPNGAALRYSLELTPAGDGPRIYTVRIPEEPDEIVAANNRRTFLISQEHKKADILYIEGHPRNEYKFIRRAVATDQTLRLVTYLKTGPHKFPLCGRDSRRCSQKFLQRRSAGHDTRFRLRAGRRPADARRHHGV
ncbi:MAG: VWA domain-containing protein [Desulfobacterales bacterium]